MRRSIPLPTSLSFSACAADSAKYARLDSVIRKGAPMYKTKIDLSEKVRRNVIVILNDRLADAIDLQSQVKQAHWNVKGPNFIALHELFDKISDVVFEQIDEIAERVTSLGGTAEGTVAVAAKRSKLKNYPLSITAGKDHLFYLSTQLAAFGKAVRAGIADTDELGDADTADLFTGISRDLDKYLWFIEAHLQDKA
ncbi:MAG TPA: DNA starvation/stationary phase protection protein Dps [Steroidobacteraceae bacterium]